MMSLRSFLRGCDALRRVPLRSWRWFPRYFRQRGAFRRLGGQAAFGDLYPTLGEHDSAAYAPDPHYFYQDVWALRQLAASRPTVHHDFSSHLSGFVGQATAICPVVFCDLRRPHLGSVPNLTFQTADLMQLPFDDNALASVSCLHVVEHVGLGRYGDTLDPEGSIKAMKQLQRVVAPGGQLLFSVPVGRPRTCFNAHRVFAPRTIVDTFDALRLDSFLACFGSLDGITDIADPQLESLNYHCGLFRFVKPA